MPLYDPGASALYLDDVEDPPQFRPLLKLPENCTLAERYAYFEYQRLVMPARLRTEDLQALLCTPCDDRTRLLEMAESKWLRVAYYQVAADTAACSQEVREVREMLRSATNARSLLSKRQKCSKNESAVKTETF